MTAADQAAIEQARQNAEAIRQAAHLAAEQLRIARENANAAGSGQ